MKLFMMMILLQLLFVKVMLSEQQKEPDKTGFYEGGIMKKE